MPRQGLTVASCCSCGRALMMFCSGFRGWIRCRAEVNPKLHCLLPSCSPRRIRRLVFSAQFLCAIAAAPLLPAFGQTAGLTEQKEAALYQEGMRLLHQKDYAEALDQFRQLEQTAPNLPQGYTGEGIALALNGKIAEAIPILQKAISIDPSFWVARRELGILDWQLQRKEDAARELNEVAKLSPDDTAVNSILGQYSFETKHYGEAAQFFSRARAQVDMSISLSMMNSEALIKSGRRIAAIEELDRLTTLPNLDPQQEFRIAWLLGEAGAYEKAIKVFSALPDDYPDPFGRDYGIALAYYQDGKYADCIQLLTTLKQRGNVREELFSLLGAAQEVSGRQTEAKAAFNEGIARFPKEDDNYLDSATLAVKDQDYAGAGSLLSTGLQQIPKSYKLFLTRGVVYSLQGNLTKAQADYEAAIALAPAEPNPYLGLGICLMDQNQYAAAADTLRGAIQKGLEDVKLNYFLVDVLTRQGLTASSPQFQEALDTVDAGIKLNPTFPYSYLQRGKLQLMAKHIPEAVDDLQHAHKLQPDSTAITYQLATAYRLAGRSEEADNLFSQVSNAAKRQDAEFRQSTLMGVMGSTSNAKDAAR
jgi:tetratricopeptide (TPR) repeat protein